MTTNKERAEETRLTMSTHPLCIIRAKTTLLGTKATIRADRPSSEFMDSPMGLRRLYLNQGDRLTINLKTKNWAVGDTLSMWELIHHCRNWTKIPWRWES